MQATKCLLVSCYTENIILENSSPASNKVTLHSWPYLILESLHNQIKGQMLEYKSNWRSFYDKYCNTFIINLCLKLTELKDQENTKI